MLGTLKKQLDCSIEERSALYIHRSSQATIGNTESYIRHRRHPQNVTLTKYTITKQTLVQIKHKKAI
jgi:hypothetical protein